MVVSGDKVRFEDNERLDIPDANALQTLVYAYLAEVLGGLIGPHSGVLTNMEFVVTSTAVDVTVDLAECLLYAGEITPPVDPLTSRLGTGGVYKFDPALSWQGPQSLDLTAFEGGSEEPYLWFKRDPIDTDLDTRRQWSVGSQTEVSVSLETRTRGKVTFFASVSYPGSGWFKFAQVTGWTPQGGTLDVPTVTLIHALDANLAGTDADDFTYRSGKLLGPNVDDVGIEWAHVGIARVLSVIAYELANLKGSGIDAYFQNPPRDMTELDTDLATAEADISDHETRITLLDNDKASSVDTLFSGTFSRAGSTWTLVSSHKRIVGNPTISNGTTTSFRLTFTGGSSLEVSAVHVTPGGSTVTTVAADMTFPVSAPQVDVTLGAAIDGCYVTLYGHDVAY